MLATLLSSTLVGLDGRIIRVEVDVAPGLPGFTIVGLADAALQEARERVRGAIRNAGFSHPPRRITVNLAPADLRKAGASLDLAIAMGILLGSEQVVAARGRIALVGELSLGGEVSRVPGLLPMTAALRRRGVGRVIVPADSVAEAALVGGIEIVGVRTLREAADAVRRRQRRSSRLPPPRIELAEPADGDATPAGAIVEVAVPADPTPDLAEVRGQLEARRALEIALGGGHGLLLMGPPGSGKTLLARTIRGLLPPLGDAEALAATIVASVAGEGPIHDLRRHAPVRAPHHTLSYAAMVGGGPRMSPGEVTLADNTIALGRSTDVSSDLQEATMRKAGVYVRISEDREGAGLGVKRQEVDCRNLAAQVGWAVTEVYVDNDLSAYSGKARPAYRQLLEDLGSGKIDAVLAWHTDRLHRAPAELEAFIGMCDSRAVEVRTVKAGELDLGTASGRMVARILGDVARHESEHKAERIRRKHLELAEAGKVVGGGSRPFGYEADRLTVRELEADLIRDAARRVLAGDSLRGICGDWNRRAVTTSTGGRWQQTVLRRLLMSGRIAGWREHRSVLVAPAVWPAIVDRPTVDRLRARLGDPARRTNGGGARRYLLSGGLLHCGRCGQPLRSRPRSDHVRRYVCASGPMFGGCGAITILAEPLEAIVTERVLDVLDSPVVEAQAQLQLEGASDGLVETLAADRRGLEELTLDYYSERVISRDEYFVARAALEARIESARRRLAESTGERVLASVRGIARTRWPEVGFDQRRAILAAVIERVTIGPGRAGFNRFDPSRLAIAWRA